MKDSNIKDVYDLLRLNNMRVAYCPNEGLGLDGPFREINGSEIVDILNRESKLIQPRQFQGNEDSEEPIDLMISGD